MLSREERVLRAKLAAHEMHARHDPVKTTEAGRAKFLQRFVDEVDPNRELPETERLRRAQHAVKAHMYRLALASAKARRRRKVES